MIFQVINEIKYLYYVRVKGKICGEREEEEKVGVRDREISCLDRMVSGQLATFDLKGKRKFGKPG